MEVDLSARERQGGLLFVDDDGEELALDEHESTALLALTDGFEAATVSACPHCRSRVLAVVALVDLLEDAPPHPRAGELLDLADEAPTLHVYVVDRSSRCEHRAWLDPGYAEWADALAAPGPTGRRR